MAQRPNLWLRTTRIKGGRLGAICPFSQVCVARSSSRKIHITAKGDTINIARNSAEIRKPQVLPRDIPGNHLTILQKRPLRKLPLADLVRSLVVLSITTLPKPLLLVLIRVAKSNAKVLESNRALRWIVNKTFYQHFCIGSSRDDIATKTKALRSTGVTGVVLTYAREAPEPEPDSISPPQLTREDPALQDWVKSNFRTIDMLSAGDYIALRVSGAGPTAVGLLERYTCAATGESGLPGCSQNIPDVLKQEHRVLEGAMRQICVNAKNKNVRILIDAEGSRYQRAIDDLSLNLMAEFNREADGARATIMNTYQLYLKQNIDKIYRHLCHSVRGKYVFGVKLVRGAYMYTEADRGIIHDSKEETDNAYDAAVSFLLGGKVYEKDGTKMEVPAEKWKADVLLATHNSHSVQQALHHYLSHESARSRVCGLSSAQLMGMADELSLSLAAQLTEHELTSKSDRPSVDWRKSSVLQHPKTSESPPRGSYPEVGVYKYTVWGTLSDCLLYMLRRAEENSDAIARNRGTVLAILKEMLSRVVSLGR